MGDCTKMGLNNPEPLTPLKLIPCFLRLFKRLDIELWVTRVLDSLHFDLLPVTSYQTELSCQLQLASCNLLVAIYSCNLPAISYQLRFASYQLPVAIFWLPVASY
ncbi:hypothetical protein SARC_00870 [Sphaeroforma arctica JP610]|uniref:Uncharacterized protein n=1 Tax=Sphaeroforma arctica JP610 TaxID=667725 RepID=A0A0L0GD87_9EUKA|nr:hypothetical protein SARC_00870 [Sphaeroforma arctica JP610]KNC86977.1 hypothetical protein SARC_00870 [Sphaeroforma arctica JP610]|eukprot:XP_014160879.1 hypothetical protein SARC_00870 [Sphaeroforma arctica JP610]